VFKFAEREILEKKESSQIQIVENKKRVAGDFANLSAQKVIKVQRIFSKPYFGKKGELLRRER
jgi:hypothetical protein